MDISCYFSIYDRFNRINFSPGVFWDKYLPLKTLYLYKYAYVIEQAIRLLTGSEYIHLKISNQDSTNRTLHCCVQHRSNRNKNPPLSSTNFAQVLEAAAGRDSIVGIQTRYGLKDPDRTRPERPRDSSSLLYNLSVPEVKQPGRGVDRPPPCSAEVKETSSVILLLPFWAFMACSRVIFHSKD
jgi:hypothetical protein